MATRLLIGGDPETVPARQRPPGTVRRPCAQCGRGVLIAPSSREFEREGATVLCLRCGPTAAAVVSLAEDVEVTFPRGQKEELRKLGISEEVARAMRARFAEGIGGRLAEEED